MKKIISMAISAAMAAILSATAPSVYAVNADSMAGKITTGYGNLNVRSGASQSSDIIAVLKKDSYVTLVSKSGSWWKVEYADGKFGYCHGNYITAVSDNTVSVATESGNLNVRSGAGKNYSVIDTVYKGENLIVLSSNGYWARVLYDGNEIGCVSTAYISENKPNYPAISLDVPDYKQTDKRWSAVKIGSSGKTIGQIGCVTTGIAMMESYRSGSVILPDAMSKKLGYDFKGNVYWPGDYSVNYWHDGYLRTIYSVLKQGKPVLIGAKSSSGSQHWVVITGYKGGSDLSASNFIINDPGSSTNTNLQQFFNSFPTLYKFFHY